MTLFEQVTKQLEVKTEEQSRLIERLEGIRQQEWVSDILSTRSTVSVPGTMTIHRHYYDSISTAFYLENYQFNNELIVFNKKHLTVDGMQKLSKNKWWLRNIKSQRVFNRVRGPERLPSSIEIPDWTSVKKDSWQLNDFVVANVPQNTAAFIPFTPDLRMNYDFLKDSKMRVYSGYWEAGESQFRKNLIDHTKLHIGVLKENPVGTDAIFGRAPSSSWSGPWHMDYKPPSTEGFDASRKTFEISHRSHEWRNRKQAYITKLFAQAKVTPNHWDHYTHTYQLGELVDKKGMSEKLQTPQTEKTFWVVDYEDIFSLKPRLLEDGTVEITFVINWDKVPSQNIEDFMKISSIFNFSMVFEADSVQREIKFSLLDALDGKIVINFDDYLSLLENTKGHILRVSTNQVGVNLAPNQLGELDFDFRFDIKALEHQLGELRFSQEHLNMIHPSQLSDLSVMNNLVFFENKKDMKLSDKFLERIDIQVIPNDITGKAVVKYKNLVGNDTTEVKLSGMKALRKVPETLTLDTETFPDKELIRGLLLSKGWNNYALSNLEIIGEDINFLLSSARYQLHFTFSDVSVANTWNNFYKDQSIIISHRYDLSPRVAIDRINPYFASMEIIKNELFVMPIISSFSGLITDNYRFHKREDWDGVLLVDVSLDTINAKTGQSMKGFKTYRFEKNLEKAKNLNFTSKWEDLKDTPMYGWVAGAALIGAGVSGASILRARHRRKSVVTEVVSWGES